MTRPAAAPLDYRIRRQRYLGELEFLDEQDMQRVECGFRIVVL